MAHRVEPLIDLNSEPEGVESQAQRFSSWSMSAFILLIIVSLFSVYPFELNAANIGRGSTIVRSFGYTEGDAPYGDAGFGDEIHTAGTGIVITTAEVEDAVNGVVGVRHHWSIDPSYITAVPAEPVITQWGGTGGTYVAGGGTINGSNDTFTITDAPDGMFVLWLNGQMLLPDGDDYTISGDTITMTTPPSPTDIMTAWAEVVNPTPPPP